MHNVETHGKMLFTLKRPWRHSLCYSLGAMVTAMTESTVEEAELSWLAANERGEDLGLSEEQIAFYDALAENESAVEVLSNDTLRQIARELVAAVRRNVTVDWPVSEQARARLRTMVKRLLRKYGYLPDLREGATNLVLEQAELLCADWAA
jgi:type I restriction enzyme R subunit